MEKQFKKSELFKSIKNNDMATFEAHINSPKFTIDIRDGFGESPLIVACENGNEAMVKKLLEKKPSIELESKLGKTALMAAIGHYELRRGPQTCFPNIIALLLDAGASCEHITSYGNPLKMALMKPEALLIFVSKINFDLKLLMKAGYDQFDIETINRCIIKYNNEKK